MRIFNANWISYNAGPSPDDCRRTEIFTMGCKAGAEGHPCKGCFNPSLWHVNEKRKDQSPEEVAAHIMKHAPNKYITFVGGEPLDQSKDLAETCKILHMNGYHIIVFTHYKLSDIFSLGRTFYLFSRDLRTLLTSIDILVDGAYDETQRIYDETICNGVNNAIGSANQIVWDVKEWNDSGLNRIRGARAGDLKALTIEPETNRLIFLLKDGAAARTEVF